MQRRAGRGRGSTAACGARYVRNSAAAAAARAVMPRAGRCSRVGGRGCVRGRGGGVGAGGVWVCGAGAQAKRPAHQGGPRGPQRAGAARCPPARPCVPGRRRRRQAPTGTDGLELGPCGPGRCAPFTGSLSSPFLSLSVSLSLRRKRPRPRAPRGSAAWKRRAEAPRGSAGVWRRGETTARAMRRASRVPGRRGGGECRPLLRLSWPPLRDAGRLPWSAMAADWRPPCPRLLLSAFVAAARVTKRQE